MKSKITTERAEKLDKLMQNVFDAIEEYQETLDRKSTRLNSSHSRASRMPSSA